MNIKLLEQVYNYIKDRPSNFDMTSFLASTPPPEYFGAGWHPDDEELCGTVACIAGWVCVFDAQRDEGEALNRGTNWGARAIEALKLEGEAAGGMVQVFYLTREEDNEVFALTVLEWVLERDPEARLALLDDGLGGVVDEVADSEAYEDGPEAYAEEIRKQLDVLSSNDEVTS